MGTGTEPSLDLPRTENSPIPGADLDGKNNGMGARGFPAGRTRVKADGPSAEMSLRQLREDPEAAHAFESLVSGLELLDNASDNRTLLLASTQPLEGKSTVVLKLGIAAASFGGKRVLLVDGDLRRPALSRRIRRASEPGLSELLEGEVSAAEVIRPVFPPDEHVDLAFVPAGCARPDFLTSLDRKHARSVLQDLSEPFDLVLIDSPPVLAVNDAVILAAAADGVLLIVGAGEVDGKSASLTKERLERSGTPILGVVLNRFDAALHGLASHPYTDYSIDRSVRPSDHGADVEDADVPGTHSVDPES